MVGTIYDLIGRDNFNKRFVIGSKESIKKYTRTETEEIRMLHKWFDYQDSEFGVKKFRRGNTESIEFLSIIGLSELKEILNHFKNIYLKEHPFSEKTDFLESILGYNMFKIESFIDNQIIFYGPTWNDEPYEFYYYRDTKYPTSEYIIYVLPKDKSIDYFKQYFRQVLKLINNIEYDKTSEKAPAKEAINQINFTNNFNEVDEKIVYNYFYESLVGKKLLTVEELNEFLKMAFQEKTFPTKKLKFNPTQLSKEKIINFFYVFMKEFSSSTHGRKKDFVNLLSGYFEDFEYQKVFDNFAKAYMKKRN